MWQKHYINTKKKMCTPRTQKKFMHDRNPPPPPPPPSPTFLIVRSFQSINQSINQSIKQRKMTVEFPFFIPAIMCRQVLHCVKITNLPIYCIALCENNQPTYLLVYLPTRLVFKQIGRLVIFTQCKGVYLLVYLPTRQVYKQIGRLVIFTQCKGVT